MSERFSGWPGFMARVVAQSRFVILVAVVALLLVATVLFVLSVGLAADKTVRATQDLLQGDLDSTEVKVAFIQVVTLVLKAVVFFIVGTGLYSLFVAPVPMPSAGQVHSLADLEVKIVSVIVVILAATFLEQYSSSTDAADTLLMGGALALGVAALIAFQLAIRYEERETEKHRQRPAATQGEDADSGPSAVH